VVVIASGALISSPTNLRGTNWQERRPALAALLGRGYVLFVAKHGSQPKYTLPEIDQDMPRAVRFIRHHASRFGIDPNRIGVTGGSSGGQLALHLATAAPGPNPMADDEVDRESSRVQAVVAYFPATDLVNCGAPGTLIEEHLNLGAPFDFKKWDAERRVFAKIDDPKERRAIFVDCSPITHVSPDDPPTLLLHGDKDEAVPIQQSKVFLKRMEEVGAECKLIEAPGKGHGWSPPVENELAEVVGWFDRWLLHGGERR
jgi:acetyl esterase/lipase